MKCVTPRVGHTYIHIRTHRVTKGGNFKSCSMQLKKYSVVRQAGLAKPCRPLGIYKHPLEQPCPGQDLIGESLVSYQSLSNIVLKGNLC